MNVHIFKRWWKVTHWNIALMIALTWCGFIRKLHSKADARCYALALQAQTDLGVVLPSLTP
jgi:hypothetical protein